METSQLNVSFDHFQKKRICLLDTGKML